MELFLSVKKLSEHFNHAGTPLPHSVSTLNKDRSNPKVIGGVPWHLIGKKAFYKPDEVSAFYTSKAVQINNLNEIRRKKSGRPNEVEKQAAIKAGFIKQSGKADVTKYRQTAVIGGAL